MKDHLLELVSAKESRNAKLNIMREYLQAYILRILYEKKFLRHAAFVRGTALRFLYDLPRFSQDIDFSLLKGKKGGRFSLPVLMDKAEQELSLAGYDVSMVRKESGAVSWAMVKFRKIMLEAGLSTRPEENLSIKVEIDTNPPEGAHTEPHIVSRYFLLSFMTYDLASLFAGKIHALLSRKYTKGRDFFDLGWYLSKWKNLVPNVKFLANALRQTGWKGEYPEEENWKDFLYEVVKETDWKIVKKDVENFLENPGDLDVLNKENLLLLLSGS
jgi:predicted nucleotidyltransferase component of viral defense system